MDVERLLWLTMEGDCVKSLLSGNDTQCFTTAQYEVARDAWIAKQCGATRGSLGMSLPPIELTRKQLRAFSPIVEVKPDVWTLRSLLPPEPKKGA